MITKDIRAIFKKKFFYLMIVWLVIFSVSPFIFEEIGLLPHKLLIYFLIPIICVMLVNKAKIPAKKEIVCIIGLQICYFGILSIVYMDLKQYLFASFCLLVIMVLYFFISSYIGFEIFAWSVIIIISFIAVLSAIGFWLAFMGIMEPKVLFERNPGEYVYTFWLTFTNQIYKIGNGYIIRPSGFFMEPGAFGFYIIHALLLNRLWFNNRKVEVLLILTGVFSISLAFYISMSLYYIFFLFNRRHILPLIIISSFIVIMIIILHHMRYTFASFQIVYEWTIGRFLSFKNYNRIPILLEGFKYIGNAPIFGKGVKYVLYTSSELIATIFGPLIAYGLIGGFIYLLHVFYLTFIGINKFFLEKDFLLLKVIFILFLNYIQRPFVSAVLIYLIIISMIHYSHRSFICKQYLFRT